MPERDAALAAIREMGGPDLSSIFSQMEWAEDEIKQAQARHPEQAELLWDQFMLMHTDVPIPSEFVYRAHCRELLERVATGADTREATDAELATACSHATLNAPISDGLVTLYMRIFAKAFPEHAEKIPEIEHLGSLEIDYGSEADELERELRRKLRVEDRVANA